MVVFEMIILGRDLLSISSIGETKLEELFLHRMRGDISEIKRGTPFFLAKYFEGDMSSLTLGSFVPDAQESIYFLKLESQDFFFDFVSALHNVCNYSFDAFR